MAIINGCLIYQDEGGEIKNDNGDDNHDDYYYDDDDDDCVLL